jgi:hypothetical protein
MCLAKGVMGAVRGFTLGSGFHQVRRHHTLPGCAGGLDVVDALYENYHDADITRSAQDAHDADVARTNKCYDK